MILTLSIVILLIGGVVAWMVSRVSEDGPRWVALLTLAVNLLLYLGAWKNGFNLSQAVPHQFNENRWFFIETIQWIPRFGIQFKLAMDGLSFWLILLTLFLGLTAVLTSWREIQQRSGFFHFNLLWGLAGVLGVFLAVDLFLFFVFWEIMLVPMYFLIAIWGHENRVYAALKFFIFTQASGLLMLISILALVFVHYQSSGQLSFDYFTLLNSHVSGNFAFWIMLGFLLAFAVKLPVVPFHTWLPDAHTEAPTAGSVILAGVLLKTGAYGLFRFVLPLFPVESAHFAPVAMGLATVGILYGAIMAFSQRDLKRLVAYTSVSHMGFVVLGVFAASQLALQGSLLQMIAHGLSTGALFIIVGELQERIHTRDMNQMGGLWQQMPRLGALGLFFAIASLGLPGLANFIGEFFVLLGTFQVNRLLSVLSALGLVGAVIYSLFLMQKAFFGAGVSPKPGGWSVRDASRRESLLLISIVFLTVWLGLYPSPVFNVTKPVFETLTPTSTSNEKTPNDITINIATKSP
jgi:NADH-quinone oxidoreductase subunit M